MDILYLTPQEMINCKHTWIYYRIGIFPFDYRRCTICDRNEVLEMPMCVWKWMKPLDYESMKGEA